MAGGILQLRGHGDLKGWQWLLLSESGPHLNVTEANEAPVEGVFTMVVAIALLFLLPESPEEPRPLWSAGLARFEDHDSNALRNHLQMDDGLERHGTQGMHIPLSLVWKMVKHYRCWPSFVSTFAVFSTWSSLTTCTPIVIVALGFTHIQANPLASVAGFLALGIVFLFGWLSDWTNKLGSDFDCSTVPLPGGTDRGPRDTSFGWKVVALGPVDHD